MAPIRRGDGTAITPKGIAEVRKGDGTVLYSAAGEIPDSENLQSYYDWREEDGSSPVTDQTKNGYDLSGAYSGVGGDINGNQAGVFDGIDDFLSNSDFPAQPTPNTVYVVFQHNTSGEFAGIVDNNDGTASHLIQNRSNELIRGYNGSAIDIGSPNTNPHYAGYVFDEANSVGSVDGTEATGDTGSRSHAGGIAVGNQGAESGGYYHGEIGAILWYNVRHDSTTRQDVYDWIESEFDFS